MSLISEVTRRDIIDSIIVEGVIWNGRLDETQFLNRIYDLKYLPSTDGRFSSAYGDIWQHCINNNDWEYDWVFYDNRFNLMNGDDETFLRFLCEMIHPVVRNDAGEAERLCQLFNLYLQKDGYEIIERTRISGRPVFAARLTDLSNAPVFESIKESFNSLEASYVLQQITRMEGALNNDPCLAIGTAKELVETCCKTILKERGIEIQGNPDLPHLVKKTSKELRLTPEDIPDTAQARDTIRRILSNLATITQGIAELRNFYGTGHGREANIRGLQPIHAKLAVGAASTLAVFLFETHQVRAGK
jgi:AbiJ N-terminal domain 3/Abortive infection C-terminus